MVVYSNEAAEAAREHPAGMSAVHDNAMAAAEPDQDDPAALFHNPCASPPGMSVYVNPMHEGFGGSPGTAERPAAAAAEEQEEEGAQSTARSSLWPMEASEARQEEDAQASGWGIVLKSVEAVHALLHAC
jgi:hypothetical protein